MDKGIFAALVVSCVGCNGESEEIDRTNFNPPTVVPSSPDGNAMTTVVGPIAIDLEKWGPDRNMPFSWPGRVTQLQQTNPSLPDDQLIYEVRLPEDSILDTVYVWVEPAKGHAAVPYSRAQAMVWSYNGGFKESQLHSGPMVTLGDSVTNYEQRYLLTGELVEPIAVSADTRIFIYVFGEWGDNAVMGLAVDTPEIVYSEP